jgi:uncharacterized protein
MTDLSVRFQRGEREVRHFSFELRADQVHGRTLIGLAAPFNSPTTIRDAYGDFTETIVPGAFTRTIAERGSKVRLLGNHDRSSFPLGKVLRLSESARGLEMEARVSDTTAGNDVLTLVRDGVVSGLSIGFQDMNPTWNADYTDRQITEAKLLEISVVADPAYADAQLTGVRSVAAMFDQLASLEAGPITISPASGRSLLLAERELDLLRNEFNNV